MLRNVSFMYHFLNLWFDSTSNPTSKILFIRFFLLIKQQCYLEFRKFIELIWINEYVLAGFNKPYETAKPDLSKSKRPYQFPMSCELTVQLFHPCVVSPTQPHTVRYVWCQQGGCRNGRGKRVNEWNWQRVSTFSIIGRDWSIGANIAEKRPNMVLWYPLLECCLWD